MSVDEIAAWIDAKTVLTGLIAFLAGTAVNKIRARVKTLEYTVHQRPLAATFDDPVFGDVKVMWRGQEVKNLFLTRIDLSNDTSQDIENLVLKVYTAHQNAMLTERTEVVGTPHIIQHTEEYRASMRLAPGAQGPTQEQFRTYTTHRDYVVPVFNRGQKLVWEYLTNAPPGEMPHLWLSTQHKGIRLMHKPIVPNLFGVPMKQALIVGLVAALFTLAVSLVWLPDRSGIVLSMIVGLTASIIGAATVRWFRQVVSWVAN
jgi:hypothetical protein